MSWWMLVIYYTCRVGCADPASLALPVVYATEQECREAGNAWLKPNANPTNGVASFACNYVKGPKESYRFRPEQE
jgi:hypothetical protein